MHESQRPSTAGPRRSRVAAALAAKLPRVRQAPLARPVVPDVKRTASTVSGSACSPGSGSVDAGSDSGTGTAWQRNPGTRPASVASRASPVPPSRHVTRASSSWRAISGAVRRRLSGSAQRPASVTPWNHAANCALPSSSNAIGEPSFGVHDRRWRAARRAKSMSSPKLQAPGAVSIAGAAGLCTARHSSGCRSGGRVRPLSLTE